MLNIGGEKMSKSLDNFTTLADALDAYDPRALRTAVLQTHYRKPVELGHDEIAAADKAVHGLDNMLRAAAVAGVDHTGAVAVPDVVDAFRRAMNDDFGTPEALGVVFEASREANKAIAEGDAERAASLVATVVELAGVLGIELHSGLGEGDAAIDAKVAARNDARAARDFQRADQIRDELVHDGIVLEDTPHGTVWRRT
jgi:cysteinyl-tRNA synthetase